MRTWIASRWRVVVASTAAVALVAGVGVWVVVQPNGAPDATVDCSVLEAESFEDANALSQACDADVEVLAERTPWQSSFATAGNAARAEVTTIPSHVLVDGEWVDLDATLVADKKNGTIDVTAPVFPMTLNAGGAAGRDKPLGSITRDGHQFDVWFPLDLPVPVLSESQAIYKLGKGIRLIVSVNVDATGFLPVVELADADAAARFTALLDAARKKSGGVSSGLDIEFATQLSDGLTLTIDDENLIQAVDAEGAPQFVATPPMMWDSSGTELAIKAGVTEVGPTDRTRSPAEGDQLAPMGVSLADTTIVISPVVAMLQDPKTVWPVYIDPAFGTQNPTKWVAVRHGGYTGTLVNWGDISGSMLGQGTGYCQYASSCNVVFYQRLIWRFSVAGLGSLAGTDITAATFNVDGQHSYNCSSQTATLFRTSDINGLGTGSNWNNVAWYQSLGARTEAQRDSCVYGGKGFRGFNALAGAQWAADNNTDVLNLGMYVSEANMIPWKRFRHNANLVIDYNRAPNVPASPQFTNPASTVCTTVPANRPMISSTTPQIAVTASDPDATTVRTQFQVTAQGNPATIKWDSTMLAAMANGSQVTVTVPASAGLIDGGVYQWRAQAFDGAKYSAAWSPWCEFIVDTSAPAAPTVTPVTTGVPAVYLEDVPGGGVGQAGKFTLDRGNAADVVSFRYGFNNSANPNTATPDATGKVDIDFPAPTTTGQVTLTVKSYDAGGNFSATEEYKFTVASAIGNATWTLDEGSGATAADTAGIPARPLTVSGGADWVDGPHALFDSRQGDNALSFNGTDQFAATTAQVLNTANSFVVSAHVKLPTTPGAGPYTALSQDGATQSGFQLGYTAAVDCPGATAPCWSFSMPDSESGASTSVFSTVPVTGGEWTYLVGEHNATTNTLRLWVCEIGTPEDPATGEPVRSQATRTATAWAAAGVFTVGRGKTANAPANYWPGAIDNIRVFDGDVLAESKIRRMCAGAEATDFTTDPEALNPTVELPE